MKHLFLILIALISINGIGQTPIQFDSTFTSYQATIVTDSNKTEEIAYVTPDKDTMYVVADMFPLISEIWNEPLYVDEKPVLIPVASISELKQSFVAKREDWRMGFSASTVTSPIFMGKDKKKEKYLVIDKYDNIEYIIKLNTNKKGDKVYKIFYSNADIWNDHAKGSLRLTMTDVGDGMKFKFVDNIKLSKIDYADLEMLRLLTKLELDLEGGDNHSIIKIVKE